MSDLDLFLAQQYLLFESKEIDWTTLLQKVCDKGRLLGEEISQYEEFLEIMQNTSYPEEKQSYQSVEIHCSHAKLIDSLKSKK